MLAEEKFCAGAIISITAAPPKKEKQEQPKINSSARIEDIVARAKKEVLKNEHLAKIILFSPVLFRPVFHRSQISIDPQMQKEDSRFERSWVEQEADSEGSTEKENA